MRVIVALLALATLVSAQTANLTGPNFHITGTTQTTSWTFSDNGTTYANPDLWFNAGQTYTISIEFANVVLNAATHPFGLTPNGAVAPPAAISQDWNATGLWTLGSGCIVGLNPNFPQGVSSNGTTPCVITIAVPATIVSQTLFYRCQFHQNLRGNIFVNGTAAVAAPSSSSSSSSSSSTGGVASSSSSSGTSTGKNSGGRLTLIPGLAIVLAAIAALCA